MATQSLYRRYRPRRFSELRGQDHVVRALRTSVAEGREGQAYLFSGPRGTGKTTSARILAKVLNCADPQDGEPCCECESCLSVEKGTSYDVHELDAASNNGVDAMRDLIEKASLGTPGRHKVYILDEVHMLSKGAEAALLKTLEEPPPHVVFVLATTDPQKMSDTIRSRTQHLQFHLVGADTLNDHVRWVADEAGLTVTDAAIEQVIAQGAGSPRDALSALELVANAGGDAAEVIALDEFVEAMIDSDPGRALTMAAHAISRGRDPRTLTEELIGFLRNGFLSLMAPELVQVPAQRLDALTDLARRLGAAGLVRGIEHLGTALTEMRQAPDPRVLLDVAIVQLTSEQASSDVSALAMRLQRLERQFAEGSLPAATAPAVSAPVQSASGTSAPGTPSAASNSASSPDAAASSAAIAVDPDTGRRKLGSRVGSPTSRPASSDSGGSDRSGADPARSDDAGPDRADADDDRTEDGSAEMATGPDAADPHATDRDATPAHGAPAPGAPVVPVTTMVPVATMDPDGATAAVATGQFSAADWDAVRPNLRGMARAVYSPASYVGAAGGVVTLALPNDTHRAKCEEHREAVEAAIATHAGSPVTVELVVEGDGGSGSGPGSDGTGGAGVKSSGDGAPGGVGPSGGVDAERTGAGGSGPAGAAPATSAAHRSPVASTSSTLHGGVEGALAHDAAPDAATAPESSAHLHVVPDETPSPVANGRVIAEQARANGPEPDPETSLSSADTLPDDDEIDVDDLIDAPPESVKTPIDRLAEAFPGSELVDDPY